MIQPIIQEVSASGEDIQKIIFEDIAPVIEGKIQAHVILALLTLTILLMKPSILDDGDKLQAAVSHLSENIVMHLSDDGEDELVN